MRDGLLALALLLGGSMLGGRIATRLDLPALVGMLLAGVALRNLAGTVVDELPATWSVQLRLVALTVILLRAGLGLDINALMRLRGPVLRLSFLPNLAEAATVAFVSSTLFGLPLVWGFLLGFAVAAVSPAVVVPGILDLQSRGYGVDKGIPTMVLAAASLDDIVAITGFGVAVSLVFADSGLAMSLLRAPAELGLGLGMGMALGLVCAALVSRPAWFRFSALMACGLGGVLGGWAMGSTGGGSLAAVTTGAVAARQWGTATNAVAAKIGSVWSIAQPVLFGLIGAAVAFSTIEPSYVTTGLLVLLAGLAVRIAVSYWSVATQSFTMSERLFVAVAWLPKATVQAAIGGLALDLARERIAEPQLEIYGTQVLTVAVLAILVTAPIGAIAIARTGPKWLHRS